jgi:hypothetical protein
MRIGARHGHELLRPLHAGEQIVPVHHRSPRGDAIVAVGNR